MYGASTNAAGDLQRVFIKPSAGDEVITTVAQRARRQAGADGLGQTIVLLDGERIEGVPGSRRYRLLKFAELRVPLAPPAAPLVSAIGSAFLPSKVRGMVIHCGEWGNVRDGSNRATAKTQVNPQRQTR